jgi:hypothetical protein
VLKVSLFSGYYTTKKMIFLNLSHRAISLYCAVLKAAQDVNLIAAGLLEDILKKLCLRLGFFFPSILIQ